MPRKPVQLKFPPVVGTERIIVERIIDGDTVLFSYITESPFTARLNGIDAPETKGKTKSLGLAAMNYLKSILPVGASVEADLHDLDKYGRLLIVPKTAMGKSICDMMVSAGHAKPYDGKGPR